MSSDTTTTTRPPRTGASSGTPVAERVNAVHRFAGAGHAALDRLVEAPAWALTAAEQAETLRELVGFQARVTELV